MKREKIIRLLNIIINLIIGISLLIFIGEIMGLTVLENGFGLKNILNIIIKLVFASCFFIATITLKKIIKSIDGNNPFSLEI